MSGVGVRVPLTAEGGHMGYKDQIRYTEDDRLLDSVNNRNTTS